MSDDSSQTGTQISDGGGDSPSAISRSFAPFRKAVFRGLAVVMPPLLTIVLFLWAWNTIDSYVLGPIEASLRHVIVWGIQDIREDREIVEEIAGDESARARRKKDGDHTVYTTAEGKRYVRINKSWIPREVFERVESSPGQTRPTTASAYYHRYVQLRYLRRIYLIPAFLTLFILVLYLVGKLLAAGVGRILWNYVESLIDRLPIIRNVYSSVKQVTDFAFSDNEIAYTRVVAIEYPRKGLWSIGFVTGESFLDIRTAANEPVLSVLMPTSPMPATGFTITVPKSETIDINISIDQAIQFCVSCGVVIPPHQQQKNMIEGEVQRRVDAALRERQNGNVSERDEVSEPLDSVTGLTENGPTDGSESDSEPADERGDEKSDG